jgi:ATPase subunit of ABC transporter with duplicated ATPase domains
MKLILEAKDLRKGYGDRELFYIESLTVYDGERIGIIGQNGAGKSTLIHLFSGEEKPDEGTVRRFGETAVIAQQGMPEEDSDGIYRSLFRAQDNRDNLSGGEQTRNRIAAALSARPKLLMADEPSTDLDEQGLAMLGKQLEAFKGALLLISHDRALLRRLCTRIWCLENGTVTDFPGGYDAYITERERQRNRQQFEYDQYKAEQKRLKESAQRMAERAASVKKAPSRMGNSEARLHRREATDAILQISHAKRTLQNRMEQMDVKEKPVSLPEIRMKLGVKSPIGAKQALEVRCECLTAGGEILLERTGFTLPTGSKTALTGANGCGKTTLLSALAGQTADGVSFDGQIRFNPQVRAGWFDQHHERTLKPEKTVLENVLEESVHPQSFARTVLSCMGFAREDAFKPVSVLSGGEKAKVALSRLLLTDLNLLILDEPTNHLDLYTLEALEELLSGYGGTILFVSHDETFVQKVSDRMVRFEDRKLVTWEGGLTEQKKSRNRDTEQEDRKLALMRLEMRMADLTARMAKPRKGDHPEELNEEYMRLAEEIRRVKSNE